MKHCILAKFKDSVDKSEKEALLPEIAAVFNELLSMEGIQGVDIIPNVIDRPNRYDVLIRIDMDQETLPVYDSSEPHHIWKSRYGDLLEKKAIFDYE